MVNLTKLKLPSLSAEKRALSKQLKNHLISLINRSEDKSIPFSQFMDVALFSSLGYYKNGLEKFGDKGDFVTSPEISPLFAKMIAPSIGRAMNLLDSRIIVEFGAGSGALMMELMQYFAAKNQPIEKYYLLDVSSDLRSRQKKLLLAKAPWFLEKIIWLDSLDFDSKSISAVILANELFDTFGFDCFKQVKQTNPNYQFNVTNCVQKKVALNQKGNLCWQESPLSFKQKYSLERLNQQFRNDFNRDFYFFADGYESELPIDYSLWFKTIKETFNQAVCFFFDYGLSNREYYSPEKNQGTMRCYYRHLLHQEPFYYPGTSDITAHVNFSSLLDGALTNDMQCLHFTTQGQFLLNGDINEIFTNSNNPVEQIKLTSEFKRLTLPTEMGEIFKVMVLSFHQNNQSNKKITADDFAFISRDLTHQL